MIFNHISESVGTGWSEVERLRLGLTHIGWMACRGAQRMNPNDSGDPLTSHLVPTGQFPFFDISCTHMFWQIGKNRTTLCYSNA